MKILFYSSQENQRFLAFGDIVTLIQSCYFKGRELGYNEVYLQWFEKNSFSWNDDGTNKGNLNIPGELILPIKLIDDINIDCDLKIDLSKPNILFYGSPPIIHKDIKPTQICLSYLNKYYVDRKERPVFNIQKTGKFGDYILIHFRYSSNERQLNRNLDISYYKNLVMKIRELYPSIKIWKFGERSPIDNLFDRKFQYFYENLDNLFELTNESKIYISSECGALQLGHMFNIPMITLLSSKHKLQGTTKEGWDNWRLALPWIIGETDRDYSYTDKQLLLMENNYDEFDLIQPFMEKHI